MLAAPGTMRIATDIALVPSTRQHDGGEKGSRDTFESGPQRLVTADTDVTVFDGWDECGAGCTGWVG